MRYWTIAIAAAFLLGLPAPSASQVRYCEPIPEAEGVEEALNQFWGSSVLLCRFDDPEGSVLAFPSAGVVRANSHWLAGIAASYGPSAVTGILAHEWGHMVARHRPGPAAELHADCLAGVFMKAAGFDRSQFRQLERVSLRSGDDRGNRWHGTGRERRRAVERGYKGFKRMEARHLDRVCPLRDERIAFAERPQAPRGFTR